MQYLYPCERFQCPDCFPLFREDGELEDGEIDDEGIGIEEENKEATEVNEDKGKEKEKEKTKEKEEKTHRHSRKRYKKTREKRRSKRRRRDRQKVRYYICNYNISSISPYDVSFVPAALSSAPLPLQQLQL